MENKTKLKNISDYFIERNSRNPQGVYFYRIASYSKKIEEFLIKYMGKVKENGLYIKNTLQNPTQDKLNYFFEKIGNDFKLEENFILVAIKKWIPQLSDAKYKKISKFLLLSLKDLEKEGKNLNMIKNAYIKYMCWFYYKFQSLIKKLDGKVIPKILFEGKITTYELKMLDIISKIGCDVVLLEIMGDENYLKIDRNSIYSHLLKVENPEEFPKEFSVINLEVRDQEKKQEKRVSDRKIVGMTGRKGIMSTNTWLSGDIFQDSLKKGGKRGDNENFFYNMFVKSLGVDDQQNFKNNLFKWKLKLETEEKEKIIIENGIKYPDVLEAKNIKKHPYKDISDIIFNITKQISFKAIPQLENLLKKAFEEILLREKNEELHKLNNRANIFLCWVNRYIPILFKNKNIKEYPVFLYYGSCKSKNERLFLKLLARIPVDVIILCVDKTLDFSIDDAVLFTQEHEYSVPMDKFPNKIENFNVETVAYNAERELDSILYGDTGLFRQNQFKNAIPITLKTTYEEIGILWDQEAKYRQGFEIMSDRVMVPAICSKVCGVSDGNKEGYWLEIEKFLQADGILIKGFPFMREKTKENFGQSLVSFIKNRKIQVDKIKKHPSYKYNFLREDMQNYIFEKTQQLLDSEIIKGTFVNGSEFTILDTVFNLNIETLRLIQGYDFTKKIPKLVIVDTDEKMGSREDSIFIAFLKFLGFDIILFVPTGYQSVEGYFSKRVFSEHQIGEYMYDMNIPVFHPKRKKFDIKKRRSILKSFFDFVN